MLSFFFFDTTNALFMFKKAFSEFPLVNGKSKIYNQICPVFFLTRLIYEKVFMEAYISYSYNKPLKHLRCNRFELFSSILRVLVFIFDFFLSFLYSWYYGI